MMGARTFSRMLSLHCLPASRSRFSGWANSGRSCSPFLPHPVMDSRDLMFSRLQRSRKIRLESMSPVIPRSCLPIWVSHSLVTTNMALCLCSEDWRCLSDSRRSLNMQPQYAYCNRLELASVTNVPPLWLTIKIIVSLRSFITWVKGYPVQGMESSCPKRPKSLLLLTTLSHSFGNAFWRSVANCSASQSDTSQPVKRMSTLPAWIATFSSTLACKRRSKHRQNFQTVRPLWLDALQLLNVVTNLWNVANMVQDVVVGIRW